MGKVPGGKIFSGVNPAAAEQHERYAVLHQVPEPDLGIGLVQSFQQTACFDFVQLGMVIADVVRHQQLCRFHQSRRKIQAVQNQPKGIF